MRKFLSYLNLLLYTVAVLALLLGICAQWIRPEKAAFLGVFGLLAPFLLVVQLGYMLYWTVQLKKKALLPLALLITSWFIYGGLFRIDSRPLPVDTPPSIRVASFNARVFSSYKLPADYPLMKLVKAYLSGVQCDVLFIQEYRDLAEVRTLLMERFPYSVGKGNLRIYSRIPFTDSYQEKFAREISYGGNGFQWADIEWEGRKMRLFNYHLSSIQISPILEEIDNNPDQILDTDGGNNPSRKILKMLAVGFQFREKQAEIVKNSMNASPHPVLACGDMNDNPYAWAYRHVAKGMLDAHKESGRYFGVTYSRWWLPIRIDFILYSPELVSYETHVEHPRISDHFPLLTRISWAD